MESKLNYNCPKCNNKTCEINQIRVAGGFWSKIFDVQGSKYTAVTCTNCKYTEFYKANTKLISNIFDLFTN